MKKFIFLFLLLAILPAANAEATNKYLIDKNHTNITWFVSHYGFSSVSGTFTNVQGDVFFNENLPDSSTVDVIVKTASLQTISPKLTARLKGEDFFDVDNHPEARFLSTSVKLGGVSSSRIARVEGELTLNGKTRPVTFKATFNKEAEGPDRKRRIGFSLTGKIKRSDFDMKFGLPDIGDEVELRIEVEAINEEDILNFMR